MSSHAEEEMLDDNLERKDVENAILKGRIEKKMTHDERGVRYRIEGPADLFMWYVGFENMLISLLLLFMHYRSNHDL